MKWLLVFLLVFTLSACEELEEFLEESPPEAEIDNVRVDDNEILFDADMSDPDDTIDFLTLRLVHDDDTVVELNTEDHDLPTTGSVVDNRFYDLGAGEYTIEAYAEYEFEEEMHEEVLDEASVEIEALHEKPAADMQAIEVDSESITFDLEVTDDDDALTGLSVIIEDDEGNQLHELTPDDNLGVGLNEGVFFEGLDAGASYEIIVLINYDDGYEEQGPLTIESHAFDTEE